MDFEGAWANYEDLLRLRSLEELGYFQPGFTRQAREAVFRYLWRIWWLRFRRELLGASPYPGPWYR